MPGNKSFLDSNILIYVYSADEPEKRNVALSLYSSPAVISTQVLNEVANVLTQTIENSLRIINPFK